MIRDGVSLGGPHCSNLLCAIEVETGTGAEQTV
jgi:hypothetical protein